jgi:peptidoglycan/LPS O-acetylase OafA/YrhL
VLSVLLFHAGVEVFSGGFVGVDIFFVISGYLITTIIHREVESGRFSIAHFYERRFRRILPAAAVVVVAVFVAGELLFPLHHQDNLARSAIAAALFSSNIYFYLESGYFADPANTMPLLHTWSLAVEEQFYVVFPLVMLSIAKFGKGQYAIWLPVLAVASLITCVVVTEENATAAFYLGHTRAWELLAGSLLAVNVFPALRDQHTREFVALAGTLMVAFSVLFFSELTIFPGLAALLPVLGTVMIIHSGTGGETTVGRCLSTRPLVFVGLISFSLYLWHWPVVVFAQYYSVVALTPALIILVLCASFFLAVVSWRYVEMPFRKKRIAAERRQMFRVSAALTFGLVTIGAIGIYGQGVPAVGPASSVARARCLALFSGVIHTPQH